jgi:hypothetical protein
MIPPRVGLQIAPAQPPRRNGRFDLSMSRGVQLIGLYDMIWREADRLEDQTNEAQVRRSTPRSDLRDSRRNGDRNPLRRARARDD